MLLLPPNVVLGVVPSSDIVVTDIVLEVDFVRVMDEDPPPVPMTVRFGAAPFSDGMPLSNAM